jgi:hypothetical protein
MAIKVTNAAPLDRFNKDDHNGHRLIFIGPKIEEGDFGFGETETAVADVICTDCYKAWEAQRIFGTMIVPRLALSADPIIAGMLVQGEAKAGRSAPWLLDDLNADELADVQALVDKVVTQLGSGKIVVDFDAVNGANNF